MSCVLHQCASPPPELLSRAGDGAQPEPGGVSIAGQWLCKDAQRQTVAPKLRTGTACAELSIQTTFEYLYIHLLCECNTNVGWY